MLDALSAGRALAGATGRTLPAFPLEAIAARLAETTLGTSTRRNAARGRSGAHQTISRIDNSSGKPTTE